MKSSAHKRVFSGKLFLVIAFFLVSSRGHAQQAELDSILRKIEYKKDSIFSIFKWVASTLEYDPTRLLLVSGSTAYGSTSQNIVREAINRRKGVCEHYATLFNALLRRAGYESYVVEGYTLQGAGGDKFGHAWNAVKTGGNWYFYDPTWAAGYIQRSVFVKSFNPEWYKIPPIRFIETHIPFDPIWQLLNPPLTHAQIRNGLFDNTAVTYFSYQDSISASVKMDEFSRIRSSLARTRSMGIPNSVVEKYLAAGDRYLSDAGDYRALNNTHKLLSNATSAYNEYIFSKNNQFKSPRWTDEMLESFSGKMKVYLDSANQTLSAVSPADFRNAQYQLQLKKQVSEITEAADKEAIFIKKYLATWKPMRMQHFYKLR
ncbi:transglutaminase domain-containing protein [Dyadobacter sp.]|uniref:transglutaminase domain-containing protein n=1 Tax=Dyadobacter sp. TaxID=1914288 RepID=UPI003F6FFEF5